MQNIIQYDKIPKFVRTYLTSTELNVYYAIKDVSEAIHDKIVYMTLSEIGKLVGIKNRNYIARIGERLVDKGFFKFRELVPSNTTNYKCFRYYVNEPEETDLFKNLSEEQKRLASVPETINPIDFTDEEMNLFGYIKYVLAVEDLNKNKFRNLIGAAKNNSEIDYTPDNLKYVIEYILGHAKNQVLNKYGFIITGIKNYPLYSNSNGCSENKSDITPIQDNYAQNQVKSDNKSEIKSPTLSPEASEFNDTLKSVGIRFSHKQINALCGVARSFNKDIVSEFKGILDKVDINTVDDMYAYIMACLKANKGHNKSNNNSCYNLSFDVEDFEKLAITYSKNINEFKEQENNKCNELSAPEEIKSVNEYVGESVGESVGKYDEAHTLTTTYSMDEIRAFLNHSGSSSNSDSNSNFESSSNSNSESESGNTPNTSDYSDESYSAESVMSRMFDDVTLETKSRLSNDEYDNTEELREKQLRLLFGY